MSSNRTSSSILQPRAQRSRAATSPAVRAGARRPLLASALTLLAAAVPVLAGDPPPPSEIKTAQKELEAARKAAFTTFDAQAAAALLVVRAEIDAFSQLPAPDLDDAEDLFEGLQEFQVDVAAAVEQLLLELYVTSATLLGDLAGQGAWQRPYPPGFTYSDRGTLDRTENQLARRLDTLYRKVARQLAAARRKADKNGLALTVEIRPPARMVSAPNDGLGVFNSAGLAVDVMLAARVETDTEGKVFATGSAQVSSGEITVLISQIVATAATVMTDEHRWSSSVDGEPGNYIVAVWETSDDILAHVIGMR